MANRATATAKASIANWRLIVIYMLERFICYFETKALAYAHHDDIWRRSFASVAQCICVHELALQILLNGDKNGNSICNATIRTKSSTNEMQLNIIICIVSVALLQYLLSISVIFPYSQCHQSYCCLQIELKKKNIPSISYSHMNIVMSAVRRMLRCCERSFSWCRPRNNCIVFHPSLLFCLLFYGGMMDVWIEEACTCMCVFHNDLMDVLWRYAAQRFSLRWMHLIEFMFALCARVNCQTTSDDLRWE